MKKIIITLIVLAVLGLGFYFTKNWYDTRLLRNPNLACGNGRIEATEINIAARIAGKVEKVLVFEGDKVKAGQPLVVMQTNVLVANLAQAEAKRDQYIAKEVSAKARVAVLESTLNAKKADLDAQAATLTNRESTYQRQKQLLENNATSEQHYQNAEALWKEAKALYASAEAAVKETEADIEAAKADVMAEKANIKLAEAEMASIRADIDDSILKAPLTGRVQYRVAEPGEVLSAGGRALNMIDLTDVYITFFLPEKTAGKVRIGSDVRIVLDAFQAYPIPAKVTYVASTAQFTPKTVETQEERQKMMFRVKAHIDRSLLEYFMDVMKTGLPGVAWVKLDETAAWPKELEISEEGKKLFREKFENFQKQQQKPGDVLSSQTKTLSEGDKDKKAELIKKAEGLSKQELIDLEVQAAKKYNGASQDKVSKEVDAAKKADEAAQKTPAAEEKK